MSATSTATPAPLRRTRARREDSAAMRSSACLARSSCTIPTRTLSHTEPPAKSVSPRTTWRVAGVLSPTASVAASVAKRVTLKTVKTLSATMVRTRRPDGGGAALTSPRARRSATSTSVRPVSAARGVLRLLEEDGPHVRLRRGVGVVGVDGDRHRRRVVGGVAVDLLEVLGQVAPLGDPLPELGGARAQHDVGDGAGFLALADRPDRL